MPTYTISFGDVPAPAPVAPPVDKSRRGEIAREARRVPPGGTLSDLVSTASKAMPSPIEAGLEGRRIGREAVRTWEETGVPNDVFGVLADSMNPAATMLFKIPGVGENIDAARQAALSSTMELFSGLGAVMGDMVKPLMVGARYPFAAAKAIAQYAGGDMEGAKDTISNPEKAFFDFQPTKTENWAANLVGDISKEALNNPELVVATLAGARGKAPVPEAAPSTSTGGVFRPGGKTRPYQDWKLPERLPEPEPVAIQPVEAAPAAPSEPLSVSVQKASRKRPIRRKALSEPVAKAVAKPAPAQERSAPIQKAAPEPTIEELNSRLQEMTEEVGPTPEELVPPRRPEPSIPHAADEGTTRYLLESGQVTPENAASHGWFDKYPGLRDLAPRGYQPPRPWSPQRLTHEILPPTAFDHLRNNGIKIQMFDREGNPKPYAMDVAQVLGMRPDAFRRMVQADIEAGGRTVIRNELPGFARDLIELKPGEGTPAEMVAESLESLGYDVSRDEHALLKIFGFQEGRPLGEQMYPKGVEKTGWKPPPSEYGQVMQHPEEPVAVRVVSPGDLEPGKTYRLSGVGQAGREGDFTVGKKTRYMVTLEDDPDITVRSGDPVAVAEVDLSDAIKQSVEKKVAKMSPEESLAETEKQTAREQAEFERKKRKYKVEKIGEEEPAGGTVKWKGQKYPEAYSGGDPSLSAKKAKGRAMSKWASKQPEIPKEGFFVGREVTVQDSNGQWVSGKIAGNAWGKIRLKLASGDTITVEPERVVSFDPSKPSQ